MPFTRDQINQKLAVIEAYLASDPAVQRYLQWRELKELFLQLAEPNYVSPTALAVQPPIVTPVVPEPVPSASWCAAQQQVEAQAAQVAQFVAQQQATPSQVEEAK